MSGIGAWANGFYHQGMTIPNDRVGAGIKAFKQALIDNGFSNGVDINNPNFGMGTKNAVIAFQTKMGIKTDGIIGPETSRYLMRLYSFSEERADTIEIPNHFLQKVLGHESGHDPVAQGYSDPKDEGEAQISLTNHPDISQQEAWTPSFAIRFASDYLKKFWVNNIADWDGAIASYNVGFAYAAKWVHAGKPSSGLIVMIGNTPVDIYTRATVYVAGVKAMPI